MKQLHWKSPHNTRLFTATLLWISLCAIVIVNCTIGFPTQNRGTDIFTLLISDPFSPRVHMHIANFYDSTKQPLKSKSEIQLIKDLLANETQHVLGAATDVRQTMKERETEPSRLRIKLEYWEQIIREKPDYLDAYIQAASIAWKLGDTNKVNQLLSTIKTLEPDSTFKQIFKTQ